ncbi:hypothetical protein [Shimia sagamensis]|uniref:Ferritin-like domain-containing protein n=1 Tax=Shimia sagamensis TaxID=1566352 RepID=A0ABY1PB28_9RHOB|nr:hypothetical protein [Shimia sagamensis]SMP30486.1 hypothetical protein SAMN06265373_10763 [Shimia sagamensis]
MSENTLTYPGGYAYMMERYDGRREPFDFGSEDLPPLDVNLSVLKTVVVTEQAAKKGPADPKTSWARKRRQIAEEFIGLSELAFLNAQLISNLRKRDSPPQTTALFCRLWAEESEHLIAELNLRWLVSSAQTFADHGDTPAQREAGQGLRMLFGMMKLYEFERTFSGLEPSKEHGFGKRLKTRLPLDMESFSLVHGGLDINILAPIWEMGKSDPVIAPLVDHLMQELIEEPGGVFRRLAQMRAKKERQQARQ